MHTTAVYNPVGGVGTTTVAHHTACSLSGFGLRVLLVDASSGCLLSSISLGVDFFKRLLEDKPEITLHGALSPVFSNDSGRLEARDVVQIRGYDNIFLIPGSFELAEYESAFKSCVDVNVDGRMTRPSNLPGSIYHLLLNYCSEYAIDHVIVDMGSSLPSINQALLFSSDNFIVPLSCDSYANFAIRYLAKTLPRWAYFAECNRPVLENSDYPLKAENPVYLGALIQDFNIWCNAPTKLNKKIIESISRDIANEFLPALREFGMMGVLDDHFLIQVPALNSLKALCHLYGLSIFDLTEEMMRKAGWPGAATRRNREKILDFERLYLHCAETLIAAGNGSRSCFESSDRA